MAPAIHIGEWQHLSPEETFESVIRWIAPTPVFNATGLPVGVQLVGRPAAEATLLSLAATSEEARPWRDRRPRFADCE
jgi:amidase